jgi:hypothetical protein
MASVGKDAATTPMTTLIEICEALACGRAACPCATVALRGAGNTHCPSHDDMTPSLTLTVRDGKVLFNCKTGCSQDSVLGALRERGLWSTTAQRKLSVGNSPWLIQRSGALPRYRQW